MKKRIDYLAHVYSETRRPSNNYPEELAKHILSMIPSKRKNNLLDIGCGRGDFLRVFSRLGFKVSGVDISFGVEKFCKPHKVYICDLDKKKIPIKDNTIDIVFTKSCIEHLYYPLNLVQEAYRVLKKDGYLIVLTPSWIHTKFVPFYLDFTHRTPFTLPSLKDILEIGGFNTKVIKHFYQLPFIWKYPKLLPIIKLFSLLPLPYKPLNDVNWSPSFNKLIRFSKEAMLLAIVKKK